MDDLGTTEILKNLISKMVAEEPENRFQELAPVIDIVEDLIGDNKPQKDTYLCSVDIKKLNYLKKTSLIENDATMTILTNSYLKNQFKECSGYYNEKFEKYIFSGKKIALECIYNAEEELFMVHKIMPLSADRKVSNIKRGFTIEGVIKFIDNRRRFNLSRISENNNEKLIIQFKNNKKNKATLLK